MKSKFCLAIETTGVHLGVSLFSFDSLRPSRQERVKLISSFFEKQPFKQSDTLIPKIKEVLSRKRLSPKDLNLIAVDMGPGSFTGVRVGVAVARGFSQMLDIPAIGITSLEAMAEAYRQENPEEKFIASCITALQGEVYFSIYEIKNKSLKEIIPPCWKKESEFNQAISKINKSSSVAVCRSSESELNVPHSDIIAQLAIKKFQTLKKKALFSQLVPLYLQPMWAERL
ncbi:MAG: tRNA (adenosine(37)-N6)-threonylcarbamoyltransferase complex dimerization subunit type 1 TsaB, partial [Elusimicrobiota bacterium]